MSALVRFACTGCGKCCSGHHLPLTLAEAQQWAGRGDQVVILIEGFVTDGPGMPAEQREHVLGRSRSVPSGDSQLRVSVTFAAFNPSRCRHLGSDDLCTIYEQRPLVCRIYPAEINPHLPLRTEAKDCPADAWQGPALIYGNLPVDPALAALIDASRQADRDDIATKVAICQRLGITTSALKGNGFTAWLPDMDAFRTAVAQAGEPGVEPWTVHVQDPELTGTLNALGLRTTGEAPLYYAFIAF